MLKNTSQPTGWRQLYINPPPNHPLSKENKKIQLYVSTDVSTANRAERAHIKKFHQAILERYPLRANELELHRNQRKVTFEWQKLAYTSYNTEAGQSKLHFDEEVARGFDTNIDLEQLSSDTDAKFQRKQSNV